MFSDNQGIKNGEDIYSKLGKLNLESLIVDRKNSVNI